MATDSIGLRRRCSAASASPSSSIASQSAEACTDVSAQFVSGAMLEQLSETVAPASSDMPPPPPRSRSSQRCRPGSHLHSNPLDGAHDSSVTRSSRSSSVASSYNSRFVNRLSLTLPLPIALPNSEPARPAPITTHSLPPTPLSGPTSASGVGLTVGSWSSPDDFTIAIAAQERRVMELREELSHAEADLATLKRHWASFVNTGRARSHMSATTVEASSLPVTPPGSLPDTDQVTTSADHHDHHDGAAAAHRRSAHLERRRSVIPSVPHPNNLHNIPHRRKVFSGNHTRALSLLSPTKPEAGFAVLDESAPCVALTPAHRLPLDRAVFRPLHSGQRAYHPRSRTTDFSTPRAATATNMASIVEDLKQGFRSFATYVVEDFRHLAVGPPALLPAAAADPGATIRPAAPPRPALGSVFDLSPTWPSSGMMAAWETDPISLQAGDKENRPA